MASGSSDMKSMEQKNNIEITYTRGMFVTVLYRMDGKPETAKEYTFKDVPQNAYYADAIAWASKNGIVAGY
ncbi:MAG: S-layer homology domain-containing protein [Hominilimicola sp.]